MSVSQRRSRGTLWGTHFTAPRRETGIVLPRLPSMGDIGHPGEEETPAWLIKIAGSRP